MQAFEASLRQRLLAISVVVELFAGSGRFSRAASLRGQYVISIDIRWGSDHDLSSAKLQSVLLGWVQCRWVRYLLAGFPCQSLTRARNRPGGPPALRDKNNLFGFAHCTPTDAAKIVRGNDAVSFVCKLLRALRHAETPCVAENPWTSWAWQLPNLQEVMQLPGFRLSRVDFCQYGMPWRKSTGFLTFNCDASIIERRCSGHSICSRSGLRHVVLTGSCNGIFLTHLAEPYPKSLSKNLVSMCENAVLRCSAERLDKYFCKLC